jgi:hypothetical protein
MAQNITYDDRPERFADLPTDEQQTVLLWIRENVKHKRTTVPEWTAYALKHYMEWDNKLYVTNGAFKGAMQRCGFLPTDPDALNWEFYVSKKEHRRR